MELGIGSLLVSFLWLLFAAGGLFLYYYRPRFQTDGLRKAIRAQPRFLLPRLPEKDLLRFYERMSLLGALVLLVMGIVMLIASLVVLL